MRFEIRHTFDCTPDELWGITDDPDFERRIGEVSGTSREPIAASDDGGIRYRKLRISVKRELPAAMKKVLGSDTITYEQETRRKLGSNDLKWEIAPMVLRDRFTGRGTTRVRATATGCERVISGELTIRVPLIGAKMEERLVSDVKASYDRAADLARETLAERG